jgi:hypothetical protein
MKTKVEHRLGDIPSTIFFHLQNLNENQNDGLDSIFCQIFQVIYEETPD